VMGAVVEWLQESLWCEPCQGFVGVAQFNSSHNMNSEYLRPNHDLNSRHQHSAREIG
jgi:hypothetical protein